METAISPLTTGLKRAGLHLTHQRAAICQFLAESKEHPSAQMIYDSLAPQFASLSLATVYNTLETLVSLGLVNELGSVGEDGVRYDADTTPHVNLACICCEKVIDLPSRHVQNLEKEVSRSSGYEILGARVLYYGLCPDCQKEKK